MPVNVVILATPNPAHSQEAAQYSEKVKPLLADGNVNVVFRGPVAQTLAGTAAPQIVLVLEYESSGHALEFFDTEAYQALLPLRRKGFSRMDIHLVV